MKSSKKTFNTQFRNHIVNFWFFLRQMEIWLKTSPIWTPSKLTKIFQKFDFFTEIVKKHVERTHVYKIFAQ